MLEFMYKEAAKQFYMAPAGENAVGMICTFFSNLDERPAKEQLTENYMGCSWMPSSSFHIGSNFALCYPGDPEMPVLAEAQLHGEIIRVYPYGITAIFQSDGSFEVTRLS